MAGIKRISLDVVKTILDEIKTNGKSKRTKLALSCRIPYDRFTKYMFVMLSLELIILESDAEGIYVNITELGSKFLDNPNI